MSHKMCSKAVLTCCYQSMNKEPTDWFVMLSIAPQQTLL